MEFYLDRSSYYDAASHDDAVWRVHEHLSGDRQRVPTFDVVIADEFQDFNKLEASFIELFGTENRILLAGDDDQALYGFRHASAEFIRQLHREDDRYETLKLPYCSRCTSAIVEATNAVVDAATRSGLLGTRISREYSSYWPDKYEEDQKHPRIDVVGCSSRRALMKFVETRISAGISILPAPDGTFIHPRAADPTKLSSSHNRPAPEAVTSAPADVQPTGAPYFQGIPQTPLHTCGLSSPGGLRSTRRASACRDR